jgi:hypothetical protein
MRSWLDMNPTQGGNQCFIKSGTAYKINVRRGQFGTTASQHAAGDVFKTSINGIEGGQQIRMPIYSTNGHTYLFTWDLYFTDSWLGIERNTASKSFQLSADSDTFFYETKTAYQGGLGSATGQCAGWNKSIHALSINTRVYNNVYNGAASWADSDGNRAGPNVTRTDALSPANNSFCVLPNRWVRIWIRIKQVANDYDTVDMWVADETREPIQIYSGLQISVRPDLKVGERISKWWIEFNDTFAEHALGSINPFRDRVAYLRNFAVLQDPPSDLKTEGLLVKPEP